jgi:hypothetical protein
LGPLARARYGRLTGTSQTTFQVSGFAVQPLWRGRPPLPELRFPVAIAAEIYPFPSRTRKSSPPAPMVLGGRPPGRVGRRRNSPQSRPSQAAGRVHPSPPRGPRRVPASLLASGPFSGPDHRLAHSVGDDGAAVPADLFGRPPPRAVRHHQPRCRDPGHVLDPCAGRACLVRT